MIPDVSSTSSYEKVQRGACCLGLRLWFICVVTATVGTFAMSWWGGGFADSGIALPSFFGIGVCVMAFRDLRCPGVDLAYAVAVKYVGLCKYVALGGGILGATAFCLLVGHGVFGDPSEAFAWSIVFGWVMADVVLAQMAYRAFASVVVAGPAPMARTNEERTETLC